MLRYGIRSFGHDLPRELMEATDDDVDDVVRRASAFLGWHDVSIERVASAIGCLPCTDVVASFEGVVVLVAAPRLL